MSMPEATHLSSVRETVGSTEQTAVLTGHLFVTDTLGRVLALTRTDDYRASELSGGPVPIGSNPWDTAVRTFADQTGIHFSGDKKLLVTTFMPTTPKATVLFVFDGGHITEEILTSITLSPTHREWKVRELEDWEDRVPNDVYLTMLLADEARRKNGRTRYINADTGQMMSYRARQRR